jgi:hypothetical protein
MTTTMAHGNMPEVMRDAAVDTALTMTAKMVGLPKDTTTKIVQAGLPLMATMAAEHPQVLRAM